MGKGNRGKLKKWQKPELKRVFVKGEVYGGLVISCGKAGGCTYNPYMSGCECVPAEPSS